MLTRSRQLVFITVCSILHISYMESLTESLTSEISDKINKLITSGPTLLDPINNIDTNDFMSKYKTGENNPDRHLNLTQLLKKKGYEVERYYVETEDGYIIAAYRIPGKGEPVLMVHGVLSSAVDWLTVGVEQGLPYLLAERGHDVWLINTRGNTVESRGHVSFSAETNPNQYWDFSWDEIGRYDLSAAIDFILHKSGQNTLKYVGHSQGNTAFFVLMSERPEYNSKVSLAFTLSPVTFMGHAVSPIVKLLSPTADLFPDLIQTFDKFDAENPIIRLALDDICGNAQLAKIICSTVTFSFTGFDYAQVNVTNLPMIFSHTLTTCSLKQLLHYGQEIDSGKFRRYDYGLLRNLDIYGSAEPPDYPLEKITVPLAVFYADDNDWFCAKKDVITLLDRVKETVQTEYVVPFKKFCHTDYLWAKDVKELVYDEVLKQLDD